MFKFKGFFLKIVLILYDCYKKMIYKKKIILINICFNKYKTMKHYQEKKNKY